MYAFSYQAELYTGQYSPTIKLCKINEIEQMQISKPINLCERKADEEDDY